MPNLCIIPSRALDDPEMTFKQLRALLAVGTFTQRDGTGVWASNKTLAESAGLDERDLRRALSELEQRGYITRTRRVRRDGGHATSIIDIVLHPPAGQTTPREEGQPNPGEEGRIAPSNDPYDRPTVNEATTTTAKRLQFQSEEQQNAYLSFWRMAPNRESFDATLVALCEGLTTGKTYTLDEMGMALLELSANGEGFNVSRLRGYLRKQRDAAATSRSSSTVDWDQITREMEAEYAAKGKS